MYVDATEGDMKASGSSIVLCFMRLYELGDFLEEHELRGL